MEELKQRLHEIAVARESKMLQRGQLVVLQLFSSVITRHNLFLLPDFSGNIFYFKIILDSKGNLRSVFSNGDLYYHKKNLHAACLCAIQCSLTELQQWEINISQEDTI